MYLKRMLEPLLTDAVKQFPALLVTGSRQCGKSTLLQHHFAGYTYVTFDDILLRNLALSDPVLFLKTYKPPVILDEIQYVPSILPYIKMQIDVNRRTYGQYILTGSQVFSTMKGVSESLAGRIAIFELYPLSWKEIPDGEMYEELAVAERMLCGFYPEFQIVPNLNRKLWLGSYLSTYIERDLRSIRNIQDLGQFQRYLVLLAARAGQILNLNEIGKEVGISQATAKDWLTLLESSFIIKLLHPYSRNVTKRVVKAPKLFFVDTGLLCYLLQIEDAKSLIHSPFAGHVFENMVIMEKMKQFSSQAQLASCYFYRDSAGLEIDLLIETAQQCDAYEIKFSSSPNSAMAQSLGKFKEEYPVREAVVLNLRKDTVPLKGDVAAKHWSVILEDR